MWVSHSFGLGKINKAQWLKGTLEQSTGLGVENPVLGLVAHAYNSTCENWGRGIAKASLTYTEKTERKRDRNRDTHKERNMGRENACTRLWSQFSSLAIFSWLWAWLSPGVKRSGLECTIFCWCTKFWVQKSVMILGLHARVTTDLKGSTPNA